MMPSVKNSIKIAEFILFLHESLGNGDFVKLSLGHYAGRESELKQIHIRRILVKRQEVLSFTYRYKTRDIVKNHPFAEAEDMIGNFLGRDFLTATLFTSAFDIVYDGQKNTLNKKPATHKEASLDHDRPKTRQQETQAPWLHFLGITDKDGKVRKDAQDKFRQIDKYIETLSAQLKNIDISCGVRVADMGAGKGYLTFALYDYLVNKRGVKAEVIGVEYRADLVEFCNKVAGQCDYQGLKFIQVDSKMKCDIC